MNRVFQFDPKRLLVFSFAALGPLGNIVAPHGLPTSFRAYYFLLPLFPVFYLPIKDRWARISLIPIPFFIFCLASAFLAESFGQPEEPYALFRSLLFACQFFFAVGAASCVKSPDDLFSILKTYLSFFFISVSIGWMFWVGYYLKMVPLSVIQRFSVETQFGFDILRFAPGSYPNEYGIVSSFVLLILTVAWFEKKIAAFHLSKPFFFFLFATTFGALLLTTTRAAYLSFLAGTMYLLWKSGKLIKATAVFLLVSAVLFACVPGLGSRVAHIVSTGLTLTIDQGSLRERYSKWMEVVQEIESHFFWGTGFGSVTTTHNVYLQMFCELGIFGTALLVTTVAGLLGALYRRATLQAHTEHSRFLSKVRTLGLLNVLSFAASNHNLNHHLTWFVCFLSLALPVFQDQEMPKRIEPSIDRSRL